MTSNININAINELILNLEEIEEEKNIINHDKTEIKNENNISDYNDDSFEDNKNEIKIYNSINTDLNNLNNFLNLIEDNSENKNKINNNNAFSISKKKSKDNNDY